MKTVWLNGVFDVLHRGHIELFKFAKSQGDWLRVGIDSDERVIELKGPLRPINCEEDRKYFLESIKYIDEVVIFKNKKGLEDAIEQYSPDIYVVGSDYRDKEKVGSMFAKEIVYFDRIEKYSSTSILDKI